MDSVAAGTFKQNDVAFIAKVADADDQYACLEEAAVPYGGLDEIADRLSVAETFMHRLWRVPRFREKLAVLRFWHAYHDDWSHAKVRPPAPHNFLLLTRQTVTSDTTHPLVMHVDP